MVTCTDAEDALHDFVATWVCLMQVFLQPVRKQAQANKEAIAAAGHAGRRADQLGAENDTAHNHQALPQRQASLNTDTRHKFANASLSAQDNSLDPHVGSATRAKSVKRKPDGQEEGIEQGGPDSMGEGSAGVSRQKHASRLSPSRDKRCREEASTDRSGRAERSSKARRQSVDGPASPQAPAGLPALPRANSGSSQGSDSSRERASLAARLLSNSWLGDMKGR